MGQAMQRGRGVGAPGDLLGIGVPLSDSSRPPVMIGWRRTAPHQHVRTIASQRDVRLLSDGQRRAVRGKGKRHCQDVGAVVPRQHAR